MADPAASIDSYLKSKSSPLAGMGSVFVAAGRKNGVDPRLVVSISGAESGFGKYILGSHNAWGWGPGIPFGSWDEAIATVTRGLRVGYLDQGLKTPEQIVTKYAPGSVGNDESQWASNVNTFLKEQGAKAGTSSSIASSVTPSPISATAPTIPTPTFMPKGPSGSDPVQSLHDLTFQLATTPAATPTTPPVTPVPNQLVPPTTTPAPDAAAPPMKDSDWVTLAPGADREGVKTNRSVYDAVAKIGQAFGKPLTITTGTNHNQYVSGSNPPRVSDHWAGNAADIAYGHGTGPDNIDPELTKLGHAALIVAGMPIAQVAKSNGGVYNIGGLQILFNTGEGGNHYNHLHVGVR